MRKAAQTRRPATLRRRLTRTYAAALLLGLLLFSALALAVLHELELRALDAELATVAHAIATIVDVHAGNVTVEESDRRQFYAEVGRRTNAIVVDRAGRVILYDGTKIPAFLVKTSLPAVRTFLTSSIGREHIRMAVVPIFEGARVVGAAMSWQSFAVIDHEFQLAISACSAAIFLIMLPAGAIGSFIAGRALRPLERMARETSEIEATDLTRRLDASPLDAMEFSHFAGTINRMLDRLEHAFERQKQFTADASHELRAPLAVIIAEAEFALRHERSNEVYHASIVSFTF